MKETLKGAIFVIVAMLIFGFMGIFVRFLNLSSHIIVFFNFLFTGIILFLVFFVKDRSIIIVKKHIWLIVLLGFLSVLNLFFFYQSYILTTISNAVLAHYTAPIFVAIFAPFLLNERLEKITIIALILSVIGLVFISYKDFSFYDNDFYGIIYGIVSGLMYAFIIILIKYLSKSLSVISINMYMSLFGALTLAPFVIASDFDTDANLFLLLFVFALSFGITATLLHMNGIKRVKSQHAGIMAYAEPFAATIYALIFFKEIPSLNTILGGILIIIGGYLIMRKEK